MNIKEYLSHQFSIDLRTMKFNHPNSVILHDADTFSIDRGTAFFGSSNWLNLESDILFISPKNYPNFFLSLFAIVTIDLNFYTHFKEYYPIYRKQTMYPKFGWTGFGVHFENPKKLLEVPVQKGYLTNSQVDVAAFVDLFIEKCYEFIDRNFPSLSTREFLQTILNDKDFDFTDEENSCITSQIIESIRLRMLVLQ